jgi:TetR/AcrR family transcriptional repressor of mexCD-oprJ operon
MEENMSNNTHDEQLLKKLAAAMTANPRATTQELATAVGISRATFNRFYGTREKLVAVIMEQAGQSFQAIIDLAGKEVTDYPAAISDLIAAHFENQEYLVFICQAQNIMENTYWDSYLGALDRFFLNGQKDGAFQLDYSNQMLTEMFLSLICGMIDARLRGRVAASGIENKMLTFFLNGISEKCPRNKKE